MRMSAAVDSKKALQRKETLKLKEDENKNMEP